MVIENPQLFDTHLPLSISKPIELPWSSSILDAGFLTVKSAVRATLIGHGSWLYVFHNLSFINKLTWMISSTKGLLAERSVTSRMVFPSELGAWYMPCAKIGQQLPPEEILGHLFRRLFNFLPEICRNIKKYIYTISTNRCKKNVSWHPKRLGCSNFRWILRLPVLGRTIPR